MQAVADAPTIRRGRIRFRTAVFFYFDLTVGVERSLPWHCKAEKARQGGSQLCFDCH
jgi:hypothetical protein